MFITFRNLRSYFRKVVCLATLTKAYNKISMTFKKIVIKISSIFRLRLQKFTGKKITLWHRLHNSRGYSRFLMTLFFGQVCSWKCWSTRALVLVKKEPRDISMFWCSKPKTSFQFKALNSRTKCSWLNFDQFRKVSQWLLPLLLWGKKSKEIEIDDQIYCEEYCPKYCFQW